MEQKEIVGKVFVVVGDMRLCLICDGVFMPKEADAHATTPCHPRTTGSELDADTLDPCSPFLPSIDCSSSPGQA